MPPKQKSEPQYLVVTNLKNKGVLGTRLISRGEPYLPMDATLANKRLAMPNIGDVVLADTSDADLNIGTADILEIITDAKELKRLRKDGTIPPNEDYQEMLAIKGNYEDKGAKTGAGKKGGRKDGDADGDGADGMPTAESTSASENASAAAAVGGGKKKSSSARPSPAVAPARASPGLNPSKISLEEQIARLDAREGNADLDDI